MEKLIVEGGRPLKGNISVSGAKNAALPIMAATLLTDEECQIDNVPRLRDTVTMCELLRSLGKHVFFENNTVKVFPKGELKNIAHYDLVSKMRGSFCVLGPMLAKMHQASVSLPGGCVIGIRPVDLHLKGLRQLGVKFEVENGYVIGKAKQLEGSQIYLGGVFGSSVLATANVMTAAVLAKGKTIIQSAACEPEIADLGDFLNKMGAQIDGHGTPIVRITGVDSLHGTNHRLGSDRIEAGSFMLMAAATKSDIIIHHVDYDHILVLIDKLQEYGVKFEYDNGSLSMKCPSVGNPVSVTTYPYPGFPTDLQAQFMALMAVTPGVSVVIDKVFPDRFMHIAELNRMGANIRREGSAAIIQGVPELYGAQVMASDLRASAALVIAALAAKGSTEIHRVYHLDRGYEDLDEKLLGLGARVSRMDE